MTMVSKGQERWGVGFQCSSRSVGTADVAWEKCIKLRQLTFVAFIYKIGNFVHIRDKRPESLFCLPVTTKRAQTEHGTH
jgi:hypothetical protein